VDFSSSIITDTPRPGNVFRLLVEVAIAGAPVVAAIRPTRTGAYNEKAEPEKMATLTQGPNVARAHDEAKELLRDLKKKLDSEADFPQRARSDRSTKLTYLLAGAMLSAILTRIFILLRQRAGRAAAGEQMSERLERVIS
jgi:hypothetical protein